MSKNLEKVIQRAISDAAFRRQLQSNPEAALRGFKLTQDEVAALRSGDAGKLSSLGIDQRMSKVFTFGAGDVATRAAIVGDLDTSGAARIVIPGVDLAASVGDPTDRTSSVLRDPDNPASARGYVGEQGATTSSVLRDPDNPASARGYIGDQAAPTSDAIEDQSHGFAATRSADVAGSGLAAPIEGSPEEFALRDQGASTSSVLRDPDNPASARGYIGEQGATTSDALEDQSHAFAATRDQAAPAFNASIIGDPDNPANARGYIGDASTGDTASVLRDPDNPASARGYIGEQGATTSDAIEDQSHGFAASRSADVGSSNIGYGANYPEHGGLAGQSADVAASARGSIIGDPDNPASARGYIGEQGATTSDAIEDQSHGFAATRSADVAGSGLAAPIEGSPEEFAFSDQGSSASSVLRDPDNPASARGYIGDEAAAPTSDALEDQSHGIAASRSDAFLSEGEVSQYSTDPNWSSDQAEDASHAFNPSDSAVIPDDGGTASVHHEPDIPT
jgi:hypothetical protein